MIALSVLSCVCEVLFLMARRRGNHGQALILKALASLCFCLTGALAWARTGRGIPVLAGLCLGLLGDVLLGLRRLFPRRHDFFFISGAVSFSLGHLCYMAQLSRYGDFLPAVPAVLVLLLASEAFARKTGFSQGRMHLPGLAYIGVEACMCAMALNALVRHPGAGTGLLSLGGLLFLVSDNLLCAHSFGHLKTPAVDRMLHASYLFAQLLIAHSILFL